MLAPIAEGSQTHRPMLQSLPQVSVAQANKLKQTSGKANTSRKTLDRVEQMNSYYEKHSPRAQRSVTLIIPHANTPVGQVGPIPSSPVPSSPGSEAGTQTAPALLLFSFLLGRRTTSTSPPRRRSTPATR